MAEAKETFPEVKGGGSLILAWQIRNKHVLVVGGGEVSVLLPAQSVMSPLGTNSGMENGSSLVYRDIIYRLPANV